MNLFRILMLIMVASFFTDGCTFGQKNTIEPKFELIISKYLKGKCEFSQIVINNYEELNAFLILIDSLVAIEIKNKIHPNFNAFSYIFTCKGLKKVEYDLYEEKSSLNSCYYWYNKKYHILKFTFESKSKSANGFIYKINKDGVVGFKEDCG